MHGGRTTPYEKGYTQGRPTSQATFTASGFPVLRRTLLRISRCELMDWVKPPERATSPCGLASSPHMKEQVFVVANSGSSVVQDRKTQLAQVCRIGDHIDGGDPAVF